MKDNRIEEIESVMTIVQQLLQEYNLCIEPYQLPSGVWASSIFDNSTGKNYFLTK